MTSHGIALTSQLEDLEMIMKRKTVAMQTKTKRFLEARDRHLEAKL